MSLETFHTSGTVAFFFKIAGPKFPTQATGIGKTETTAESETKYVIVISVDQRSRIVYVCGMDPCFDCQ